MNTMVKLASRHVARETPAADQPVARHKLRASHPELLQARLLAPNGPTAPGTSHRKTG
ncbi:MAG: hypothetical protein M3Y33_00670 [Actinomycetota bacterium]|nr:hypothetical protein [Actinomycetota bacterium]